MSSARSRTAIRGSKVSALALALASCIAACDPPAGDQSSLLASTVVLDESLKPALGAMPDEGARTVARVADSNGTEVDFVAREIVIVSASHGAVESFAARWGGSITRAVSLSSVDKGEGLWVYLVRVDPDLADTAALSLRLGMLTPGARGDLRVSSDEGLRTLAIAAEARESAGALRIGLNWIMRGSEVADRVSNEAPFGKKECSTCPPYSQNAFDWDTLRGGGPLNIGVTDAWRALELGDFAHKGVVVAVIDSGFNYLGNLDIPEDAVARSAVVGQAREVPNTAPCSGGGDCPWHGTNVSQVLAGVADNEYGTVGVAHQVAQLVTIRADYEALAVIAGIAIASEEGARIINISSDAPVPAILGWATEGFDAVTLAARASGILIFAAAGNEDVDVDAEDCVGVICWERTRHLPCEADGVVCVGGVDRTGTKKADGSNYGAESVRLHAPYRLLVGPTPDPSTFENRAYWKNGTSFSSPYAAGVAALVWAVDPTLSADAVADRLWSTGTSFSGGGGDTRYVNARAAVLQTIGNVPPSIEIVEPTAQSIPAGNLTSFTAAVDDFEDGPDGCTIQWFSSLDGFLSDATTFVAALSKGTHTITVIARDQGGAETMRTFLIGAGNVAPTAAITSPPEGAQLVQNAPYIISGLAGDLNSATGLLPCSQLQWSSPADPWMATGCNVVHAFPSLGPATIVLKATDEDGLVSTVTRQVQIVPPTGGPPNVAIIGPWSGQAFGASIDNPYAPTPLDGVAVDPDGGAIVSYRWTFVKGGVEHEIQPPSPSPAFSWTASNDVVKICGGTTVELRLYATDVGGEVGKAAVMVQVVYDPC